MNDRVRDMLAAHDRVLERQRLERVGHDLEKSRRKIEAHEIPLSEHEAVVTLARQTLEASNFQPTTRFPVLGERGELVGYTFATQKAAIIPVDGCPCANCEGLRVGEAPEAVPGCMCAACTEMVGQVADAKKPYGDVEYADSGHQADKKKRYPLDSEEHIRSAWSYINQEKNAGAYSADDLSTIKSKIVAAWKAKIDKDGPPSAQASATLEAELAVTVPAVLSAAQLELLGPADDAELPPALRGKGLVRGKAVATFALGRNETRDGRVFIVDDRAVQSLLADGNALKQPAPLTYLHEDGEARNAGYVDVSHGPAVSVLADEAGRKFISWNRPYWTAAAAQGIATGERGGVSPDIRVEALNPKTLEILTPSSPLYVGPGRGMWDTAYLTNTFRPMKWRVPASLVPVPALLDLPPASLTAASATSINQTPKEEPIMDPKLAKLLGLPAAATEEQKTQALAAAKTKFKLPDAATEAQMLALIEFPEKIAAKLRDKKYRQTLAAAAGSFDKAGILGLIRASFKIPEVVTDEILSDMVDKALEGAEKEAAESDAPPAPMAAKPPEQQMGFKPEDLKAAASTAANALVPGITAAAAKSATEETQRLMAAAKKAEDVEKVLLAAEKDGKIVPARREEFRMRLSDDKLAAGARQELSTMRGGFVIPGETITGGELDPSISVDELPPEEASEILSRAAAWSMQSGKIFPHALEAVRSGDPSERTFHNQVLASDPGWGDELRGKKRTRNGGAPWKVSFPLRPSSDLATPTDYDPELVRFVQRQIAASKIPTDVLPREMQDNVLLRMKLSEAGNFQPGTRFAVPGFSFGFLQGSYAADEVCPPITGGVNDKAYYPIYGTEHLQAFVGEDGYPIKIGRNTESAPESRWNVDFQNVTLFGDAHQVKADRQDQAAGDAILPIGVLADSTDQALTILKNNREIWVSKMMRTSANYAVTSQFAVTGARQYSDPTSTPLSDFKKVDAQLLHDIGQPAEWRLIPFDVLLALQYHPDFTKFAQLADQGSGTPRGYAPVEHIVAVLGPVISPTARISTRHGGTAADTPWGQDVICGVSNRGVIRAPRAFATVIAAGWPIVRTIPKELSGLSGADVVKASTKYAPQVVGLGNDGTTIATATKSAFLLTTASPALGQTSL